MSFAPRIDARWLAFVAVAAVALAGSPSSASVFINEIHYDNVGTDAGELIEVAGTAGTDLSDWWLYLYTGGGGQAYNIRQLFGLIPNQSNGFGTLSFIYDVNGIQNGAPDGIALANGTTLIQFLSYEGTFTAVGGVANGVTSVDIGVDQDSAPAIGRTLQLIGTGNQYSNFTWTGPVDDSPGSINAGQSFTPLADAVPEPYSLAVWAGLASVLGLIGAYRRWTCFT